MPQGNVPQTWAEWLEKDVMNYPLTAGSVVWHAGVQVSSTIVMSVMPIIAIVAAKHTVYGGVDQKALLNALYFVIGTFAATELTANTLFYANGVENGTELTKCAIESGVYSACGLSETFINSAPVVAALFTSVNLIGHTNPLQKGLAVATGIPVGIAASASAMGSDFSKFPILPSVAIWSMNYVLRYGAYDIVVKMMGIDMKNAPAISGVLIALPIAGTFGAIFNIKPHDAANMVTEGVISAVNFGLYRLNDKMQLGGLAEKFAGVIAVGTIINDFAYPMAVEFGEEFVRTSLKERGTVVVATNTTQVADKDQCELGDAGVKVDVHDEL